MPRSCEFSSVCEAAFKGSWTCEHAKEDCRIYYRFLNKEIVEFKLNSA